MPPTSSGQPGSTTALRAANEQRVLDVLRVGSTDDQITQAGLARATGLAPATVSNIVRELAAAGLVDTEPGSGRRGTVVTLARSAGLVIGIDFGHSHVGVAIGDLRADVLTERRTLLSEDDDHQTCLAHARTLVEECLAWLGATMRQVRTVSIGLPAPITDGVANSSAILPGWVGIDARQAAYDVFGVPVHVENDANLGALAEHRAGVAEGTHSSVFVKISSGVGAGIVINDQLFHGHDGTAGEVGHLTVDEAGPVCRCGSRGCLEAYAAVPAVLTMLSGSLHDTESRGIDAVVTAARAGHAGALRALEDAGLRLGWGLASIVNLLNPALVVVGGDMARAGEFLLEPTRIGLRRHALDAVAATPVVTSKLGERASLVGAVLLAAERTEIAVA